MIVSKSEQIFELALGKAAKIEGWSMNSRMSDSTLENLPKLTYSVLVENTEQGWLATSWHWPNCKATGKTRQEAIENLRQQLIERIANAQLVQIEIDNPHYKNPWTELAGMFKDDPQWDEFMAAIESYRHELDAVEEEYQQKEAGHKLNENDSAA